MLSPATAPTVSIVIPVFNKWELTWKCLMAIAENTRDVTHEVIVIDNASSDDTAQALPLLDNIRFARNTANLGFARASNQGAAMAAGKYLLFLNNDTEPTPGWLQPMVAEVEADPAVAIVGSKLLYPDGTVQHGGVVFAYAGPEPITPLHLHARQPASASHRRLELRAVTAACMLDPPRGLSRARRVRRSLRQRRRGCRSLPQGLARGTQDRLHARERRRASRVGE